MFAELTRSGGAAARLMAAVDADEDRLTGLARMLEAQPLAEVPDLGGLLDGQRDAGSITKLLARLAASEGQKLGAAAGEKRSSSGPGIGAARKHRTIQVKEPQGTYSPEASTDRLSPPRLASDLAPLSHSAAQTANSAMHALLPQQKAGRSATAEADVKPGPGGNVPEAAHGERDPIARATLRPVGRLEDAPKDRLAAVLRSLSGSPAVASEATDPEQHGASPVEAHLRAVLLRLDRRASAAHPRSSPSRQEIQTEGPTRSAGKGQSSSLPLQSAGTPRRPASEQAAGRSSTTASNDQSLALAGGREPRNGLERLLARRQVPLTPPTGAITENQAALSPNGQPSRPDLAKPQGTPQSRQTSGQVTTNAPAANEAGSPSRAAQVSTDAGAMARALHDLIRQEARAAGIDIGGGAP
ncbi:MAG: hypothetical protein AAGF13_07110 [Pseudomonadota bacterium]